jgi:cytochrome c oxidase assembly protein subunit 15
MTWLHRFAKVLVAATFLLVLAGGLVTTTGSGLAVRDWPSYGWAFFTVPRSAWGAGFVYQHGHRLIATIVGLLTVILVGWMRRSEPRRWVRLLAMASFGLIILQGALGGLAVVTALPPAVSIAHASLALLFFCATVALALFTSSGWLRAYRTATPATQDQGAPVDRDLASANAVAADLFLRRLAIATAIIVYVQVLISAVVRHLDAGLAIPDYPLAFGRLVPPPVLLASAPVAAHFAHRLWAVVSTVAIFLTAWRIWTRHPERLELLNPAGTVAGLVLVEIALGGLVVMTGRNLEIDTAHLAAGALILATSVVIALRAYRPLFGSDAAWLAQRERQAVRAVPVVRPSSASALGAVDLGAGSTRG